VWIISAKTTGGSLIWGHSRKLFEMSKICAWYCPKKILLSTGLTFAISFGPTCFYYLLIITHLFQISRLCFQTSLVNICLLDNWNFIKSNVCFFFMKKLIYFYKDIKFLVRSISINILVSY
jgi:hypothetical protein